MSFMELPGALGVVFAPFPLPAAAERSRNKERLEASLSGLHELELLKQRQESLVLGALLLGDSPLSGRPDAPSGIAGGHARQRSRFQLSHVDSRSSLEEHVAELKINTEVKSVNSDEVEHKPLTSGEPDTCPEPDHHLVIPCSLPNPQKSRMTKREKILLSEPARQPIVSEDTIQEASHQSYEQPPKTETLGLIQSQALPLRPSKPRTSLTNEARVVSVLTQVSSSCKDEQLSSRKVSLKETSQCSERVFLQGQDQAHHQRMGCSEDATDHQLNVLHQLGFCHKPRQASIINTSKSVSLDHPPSRVLHTHQHSSKTDSPQHFKDYPSPSALTGIHERSSLEEQLVSAEYVPAHPCQNSSRAHHVPSLHKDTEGSKTNQSAHSLDPCFHQEQQSVPSHIQHSKSNVSPKKCQSIEDRSTFAKKVVKKAYRSQVQCNLQRVSDRKCSSVDKDCGRIGSFGKGSRSSQSRMKRQQQSDNGHNRCQSIQELSQDGVDHATMPPPTQKSVPSNHFVRRVRKPRPTHSSVTHYQYSYHHQAVESRFEKDKRLCQDDFQAGQGESESTASEPDPTESSSLSSDSDESGGLVWQFSPQLSPPLPPASSLGASLQPKAFVKIKASHALKKKILRFRTGSLKVMTTV
uniref:Dapper homolog 1-like n=1 Tax=Oryzias latipes TaxID=8090 RepID=A0A3P9I4K6_ORYLA